MRSRREVESGELAQSFRAADRRVQRLVAEQLVLQALAAQQPPLELPADAADLEALLRELDASDDEADFRRARAVAAEQLLRGAAYEEALYEAVHAAPNIEAVRAAREALG